MPRTAINLEDEIFQLFRDGTSCRNIAAHIRVRHGISVTDLQGPPARMAGSETKPGTEHEFGRESALHDRIKPPFFEQVLEDKEMHHRGVAAPSPP